MKPFHSLWVKLLAAFALVVAVAIGTTALLANRVTTQQFQLYVSQGKRVQAERLAPDLAAYYAQTGEWAGVSDWLAEIQTLLSEGQGQQFSGGGQGRGRGLGQGFLANSRLVVAGPGGQVVADSGGELVGRVLSDGELGQGVSIVADGETVGTLIVSAEAAPYDSLEAGFLEQVNRYLLWSALVAGVVAVSLGLLLARQLTAPLRALTRAAQRMAHEDPAHAPGASDVPQVEIRTQDEIGELGQAFNRMALSLAQQEVLRRNLLADIAHELRTPLTVIRGDLEALLDGVYAPTPETLGSLQEETLLLSRLVDDLRALAQAEAGQLRLERQPTDLKELVRSVAGSLNLEARARGQTLTLEIPPRLPWVDADPQRVRQVVANLVSNALRHASATDVLVAVSAVEQSQAVQVAVEDNGTGISEEELTHVFDRFWRGDITRETGSGLGLAIARELVRAHGGRIWVVSSPSQGTTFSFTLPQVP